MNPVLPSPWKSSAPLGFSRGGRRRDCYQQHLDLYKHCKDAVSQNTDVPKREQPQQLSHQDSLFRNLNRNTLILTFPGVTAKQIDTTLSLCNNNLSAAITILKVKSEVRKKTLTANQNNQLFIPHAQPSPSHVRIPQPKKEIIYIPTKYEDVQIVEENITPNNIKLLKVPHVTQVSYKGSPKYFRLLPRILPKIISTEIRADSIQVFSSGAIISTPSQESVKLEDKVNVENSDRYDGNTPSNKIGVIFKKEGQGYSVKLL